MRDPLVLRRGLRIRRVRESQQAEQGGEHYVAFSEKDVTDLAPSRTHTLAMKLHNSQTASLALAHVDQVTCADGARWVRN